MSNYTPGPWEHDSYIGLDPYDDPDEPFVEIGGVRWMPNRVDIPAAIEAKANACLMAAAPELLEALENLERTSGLPAIVDDPSRVAARAAIAKAKGNTK